MKKHVAVLMGGLSAEREVSLVSGRDCAAALREAGFTVSEIDVGHDLAELVSALTPAGISIVCMSTSSNASMSDGAMRERASMRRCSTCAMTASQSLT